MAYFIDLFSPTTLDAFNKSNQNISGFSERQKNIAKSVKKGDVFVCYVTKAMRWIGALEVTSDNYFLDNTPIFLPEDDKYIVRFNVKPIIWLDIEHAIPVYEDLIWSKLSFTKDHEKGTSQWTGMFRNSLKLINDEDGKIILDGLKNQQKQMRDYPLDLEEYRKLVKTFINIENKSVAVTIPQEDEDENGDQSVQKTNIRESIKIQALLAEIGEKMGYRIWIPKRDRSNVLSLWNIDDEKNLVQKLPMDYGPATMNTIEEIDVLWLKNRYIIRAFEVEHTTSIYSGILRMADLIALQPNLEIKLQIVAPYERKDKVQHEIQRPVFSLIENKPLHEICTFLSYDKVEELASEKRIRSMNDSVIDELVEETD